MNILLDTHAFIWWNEGDARISTHLHRELRDPANTLWLSMASVWEMQIKSQLGKLQLQKPLHLLIEQEMQVNRLRLLSISLEDIYSLARLPALHRDPFDRIIVSQAIAGGFHLVTNDTNIRGYHVPVLW
ncbi:PIN domain nuclease, a component of toxin-antitoxin system (PIN domain) [Prosthecobacter debontii]|uniref:PIN domain nuclease, a component of toxin-antitoxin system (PIN domain) n=1 Tax=Prosthecobacter debontii TaxID=48467 RepID=A0A1T4Y4H5_9BACT|nr:type II toxin-antitoxin system VapC family toxin [Prosthecobacter debontii]SKA96418.1 PIN domain nuclease, a component of toxin-antitoxin system (PIN domain) [Prosthecobacter debontii]